MVAGLPSFSCHAFRLLCLLFVLFAVNAREVRAAEEEIRDFTAARQDSTGLLWAIRASTTDQINVERGNLWRTIPHPGKPGGWHPKALGLDLDGAVLCLWTSGDDQWSLTRHNGASAATVSSFHAALRDPILFVDSAKKIWITESGPDIYRISDGVAMRVHSIAQLEYQEDAAPKDRTSPAYPVQAIESADGRIWFWSCGVGEVYETNHAAALAGVLIFDGNEITHHKELPGLPSATISVIEKKDNQHFWVGLRRDGLYLFDTAAMGGERVADAEPKAFFRVERIFQTGDLTYVATNSYRTNGRRDTLWSYRDGQWQKVISDMDLEGSEDRRSRPWLATRHGILFASFGRGLWLLPDKNKAPKLWNWQAGFPLISAQDLFDLGDERFAALSSDGRIWIGRLTPPEKNELAGRVSTFAAPNGIVKDRDGNVWALRLYEDPALSVWQEGAWKGHSFEGKIFNEIFYLLASDSRGRLWIMPDNLDDSVVIYDPPTGQSQRFANFRKALEGQNPEGLTLSLSKAEFDSVGFSGDGRICFRKEPGTDEVHYFDGSTWKRWRSSQIRRTASPSVDRGPFFTASGALAVVIAGERWELAAKEEWSKVANELTSQASPIDSDKDEKAPVKDDFGSIWVANPKTLDRRFGSVSGQIFSSYQNHPFKDGRRLEKALVDRNGTAFLETINGRRREYVSIAPKGPLMDTAVELQKQTGDTVVLKMSTPRHTEWYFWRLNQRNDGEWKIAYETNVVTLGALENGNYTFQALAIGSVDNADPTPAQLGFAVSLDREAQLGELLAQLQSSEANLRQKAALALEKQSATALPAVRQAREAASEDVRWWFDTVIQALVRKIPQKEK